MSDWDEQKSEEDSGDSQWRAVAANDKPDMSTRLRRDEAERQGEDQAKRQKQRVIGGRRDENDHQHDEADQMAERLAARKIQSVADEDQEKISEDGQRRGELELFVNYLSKARPAESKEIGPGATGENGKLQPAAKEEVASRIIREGKQVQLDIYSCKNAETKVSQKPVNETHRQKRIGISQGSCDWIENQRRRPVRAAMKHGIPMFQQKSDESAVAAVGVNDIKATQDRESMEQEDTDYANGPRQATFREGYARRIIRWPGERRLRCVLPAIKSRSWSANCSRVLELAKRVGRSCELVNLDFFAKRCFATSHLLKTRLRDQQFRDRRHQFFSEGKLHSILSRGRWVSHSSRGAFI